ncbi:Gfo/Idh/MocA family protein [Haladaptatus sp. DFWS20]|uniref:Gfo/Idh/MocA family protein n=1 Tax=Haladaptatus sp. DFWS20 TaxID=3403467 RepID=UPI003EBA022E
MQRIGLVGRGFMARVHARRYAAAADARVVGVASPSGPEEFVESFVPEATAYKDVSVMFDEVDLDAVDICTPTDTHHNLVIEAARRGFDVRCEKPLARTLTDACAVREAVEDADVACLIGHVTRFFPAYARAKERIDAGEIGDVGNVRTVRRSPVTDLSDWFGDRERSGGTLLDLAIHDFDFLRWVCGDIERVFARRSAWDEAETTLTTLRFVNGTVGHVDARWTDTPGATFSAGFELSGDAGLIEHDTADSTPLELHTTTDYLDESELGIPLERDPYQRQIDHFLDCVRGDDDPRVTINDAIATLRVSLAALESADRRVPVTIADVTS